MSPISNDPLASLSAEERAIMLELLTMLVGRAKNRKQRLLLFTDVASMLTKEEEWLWPALQAAPNRKQELSLILVNGRLSTAEITTRL